MSIQSNPASSSIGRAPLASPNNSAANIKEALQNAKELLAELKSEQFDALQGQKFGKQNKLESSSNDQLQSSQQRELNESKLAQQKMSQVRDVNADNQAALQGGSEEIDQLQKKEKKKTKNKAELKRQLAQLFGIAKSLEDVEFEDKDHQKMIQNFLSNMNQIRNMQKRIDQLDILEEKYEKEIEKENEAPKTSSIPKNTPHSPLNPSKPMSVDELKKQQNMLK